MKHLGPTFTWQEYLDWAEEISPDATFNEVRDMFDRFAAHGVIAPSHIDADGNFVYELHPDRMRPRVVVLIRKGLN